MSQVDVGDGDDADPLTLGYKYIGRAKDLRKYRFYSKCIRL